MQQHNPSISTALSSTMIPPQSIEAEQAVLGTILLQDKALLKIVELIRSDELNSSGPTTFIKMRIKRFMPPWCSCLKNMNRTI